MAVGGVVVGEGSREKTELPFPTCKRVVAETRGIYYNNNNDNNNNGNATTTKPYCKSQERLQSPSDMGILSHTHTHTHTHTPVSYTHLTLPTRSTV